MNLPRPRSATDDRACRDSRFGEPLAPEPHHDRSLSFARNMVSPGAAGSRGRPYLYRRVRAPGGPAVYGSSGRRGRKLGGTSQSWPTGGDGLRELVAVRPYLVLYEGTSEGVQVLHIKHGAQGQD